MSNAKKGKVEKDKDSIKRYMGSIIAIIMLCLILSISIVNLIAVKEKNKNNLCKYSFKVDKNENIVFLGDSITYNYPTEELFAKVPLVNSGWGGNTTDDILNEIKDRVYKYNPTKVFIMIGINDIGKGKKTNYIYNNIQKIIKEIKTNKPKADIYVESILPVNEKIENWETKNQTAREVNKKLKQNLSGTDIKYIEIDKYLKNNKGQLREDYTVDGIHLTDKAYLKVTNLLYEYIYN